MIKDYALDSKEEEELFRQMGHYGEYYIDPKTGKTTIFNIGRNPKAKQKGVIHPSRLKNNKKKRNRSLPLVKKGLGLKKAGVQIGSYNNKNIHMNGTSIRIKFSENIKNLKKYEEDKNYAIREFQSQMETGDVQKRKPSKYKKVDDQGLINRHSNQRSLLASNDPEADREKKKRSLSSKMNRKQRRPLLDFNFDPVNNYDNHIKSRI